MKISFLGTAAAEGVPAEFCDCENCINIRALGEKEYRTRSQVAIDGELLIDFPPESYSHSLRFGVMLSRIKYLLVTHSHMDHFYAHDFVLRGYKYANITQVPRLEIYGNGEVEKVFGECTAREMKPEVAPNIRFNKISSFSVFTAGKYKIIAIPARHGNAEEALLYYVESDGKGYLHLYDTGIISDEAADFLAQNNAKADIVALDCTFGPNSGGDSARHMGIGDNMLVKDKLLSRQIIDGNAKIVITHFSHNCNPTRENLKKLEEKYGVTAAYDGYTVDV